MLTKSQVAESALTQLRHLRGSLFFLLLCPLLVQRDSAMRTVLILLFSCFVFCMCFGMRSPMVSKFRERYRMGFVLFCRIDVLNPRNEARKILRDFRSFRFSELSFPTFHFDLLKSEFL